MMSVRDEQTGSTQRIPVDPDLPGSPRHRPTHLRWRYLGGVAIGGAVGTALRDIISSLLPAANGVSWSIFWINIAGAFLLGVLLESLARAGDDTGVRRMLRLLLGTGVLGGFTTYSTLATSTAELLLAGRALAGTGYALLTLIAGLTATGMGFAVVGRFRHRGQALR